ncbi:hypothetical protein D3C83_125310 [compost metagenome]
MVLLELGLRRLDIQAFHGVARSHFAGLDVQVGHLVKALVAEQQVQAVAILDVRDG